ncbi:hypothetical protein EDB80DRAFT_757816 [Ilyonectria destructans]|nr:hypothetical protein EDB80DRAFT_757816 [Ilyonectria destructans]
MSYQTCDRVSPECPIEWTIYGDYFTLGATATYAALFGLLLNIQLPLAYKAKTWSFGAWLATGAAFEFIGYVGRSVMTDNPWNFEAFISQNLCLVLGPTLVTAAISITFKHLVLCAASSNEDSSFQLGSNLLLAGVSFQVVNMAFCGGLILIYVWRRRQAPKHIQDGDLAPCSQGTPRQIRRNRKRVGTFIWGRVVAYIAIIVRCIYRIPEMAMVWGSDLMQREATFMSLDGAMLLISCGLLTICHPAIFFPYMGQEHSRVSTGKK